MEDRSIKILGRDIIELLFSNCNIRRVGIDRIFEFIILLCNCNIIKILVRDVII